MQNPFRPHDRSSDEPRRPDDSSRSDGWRDSRGDPDWTAHQAGADHTRGGAGLTPPSGGDWNTPPSGQVARGSALYGGPGPSGGGMYGQSDYGARTGGGRVIHQGSGGTYGMAGGHDDHGGEFEPDYLHWREQQMRTLDDDYRQWRTERRERFASDFTTWRSARDDSARRNNLSASGVQDVADGGPGRSDAAGARAADADRD
jgi:hypothetical protein